MTMIGIVQQTPGKTETLWDTNTVRQWQNDHKNTCETTSDRSKKTTNWPKEMQNYYKKYNQLQRDTS